MSAPRGIKSIPPERSHVGLKNLLRGMGRAALAKREQRKPPSDPDLQRQRRYNQCFAVSHGYEATACLMENLDR